jgi:hypothetical protein
MKNIWLGSFIQAMVTSVLYASGIMYADTQMEFSVQQLIAGIGLLFIWALSRNN